MTTIREHIADKAAEELQKPVPRFSAADIADRDVFSAEEEFVRAEWLDMALGEIERLKARATQ